MRQPPPTKKVADLIVWRYTFESPALDGRNFGINFHNKPWSRYQLFLTRRRNRQSPVSSSRSSRPSRRGFRTLRSKPWVKMSTTEVNRDDEIIAQVLATYTTPVSKIKCKVYLNGQARSFSDFLPASAGKSRYTTDRRASCSGDTFASTAIKA